ncbi:type II toxin-antitoxin system VapB family antitoxin [Paraburkholderia phosphatilytica]|uniref:type II toxin-antitoxin system VapB family antitoxin n=1 Tax=Paraburkholderia phosphatilytica TaxID=2282883 RepID=UPI000E4C1705|nr:type II toxin-antitoxin system VapB family antitoxin [Paraburkholderia phosphatilytica]
MTGATRTTIVLDDDLVSRAQDYTGLSDMSELVREALKALVEREAARRLAALGGTQPGISAARRRK